MMQDMDDAIAVPAFRDACMRCTKDMVERIYEAISGELWGTPQRIPSGSPTSDPNR